MQSNLLFLFIVFKERMNNIKSVFSIKDLENLSGIKAHTIRIWEKRYNVLEPMRTETNIRLYDSNNLQKLLNITLLHNHGYKISKISKLKDEEIPSLVSQIISDNSIKHHAISSFKMAMMNFDQSLFLTTYDKLLSEKPFREIFTDILIPFIIETGFLWQTSTISVAHEHFISYLIQQKLLIHTEKLQYQEPQKKDKVFILFLPQNEIHQLGLMYLNYEILFNGYKSIYLGENVPIESLKDAKRYFDSITYLCYMTVEPNKAEISQYLDEIKSEILIDNSEFWAIGRMVENIKPNQLAEKMAIFTDIKDIVALL